MQIYTFIKKNAKKIITFTIKFLLIYILSFTIVKFFYRNVDIKALHLDDLHNLIQCIKYPDVLSWIIPYSEGRMHYRPVFYLILFLFTKIIGTKVSLTLTINFCLYSGITTILYFLTRSINIKWYFALIIIIFASIINFNYYEIYQLIGFIEGFPMLFSMIILILSIRFLNENNKKANRFLIITSVLYLLMVFTHERYFPMLLIPIIALCYNKNIEFNVRCKMYLAYAIELLFFFLIRYYHLRIWIPRGTDCTSLIDYFDLQRSFKFIYHQFMYLCGINLGPEYLCGRSFASTDTKIQNIIITSSILMFILILLYIVTKISHRKTEKKSYNEHKNVDILFILYIILCILQSSLTIRVELRWLLASFICLMFYILHMLSYIIDNEKCHKIIKLFSITIFVLYLIMRVYMCIYFRDNNMNIFIINEQKVVNSLYEVTVEKYGIEKIKNSKILITSNMYRTLIEEEKTHFFDQYDRKLSDNHIIYVNDSNDENINFDDYDIVLAENGYLEYEEVK